MERGLTAVLDIPKIEGKPQKHCREKPLVSYSHFCKPVYESKPAVLRSAVILQNCFLFLSGNELSHTVSGSVVSAS